MQNFWLGIEDYLTVVREIKSDYVYWTYLYFSSTLQMSKVYSIFRVVSFISVYSGSYPLQLLLFCVKI